MNTYGAQHPPSLKIIQDLLTNTSSAVGTGSKNNKSKNFKDFEKKTDSDWVLDFEDCALDDSAGSDYADNTNSSNNDLPAISVEESNEMAKRIIKDHKDKQMKYSLKNSGNMPGKAQRQFSFPSNDPTNGSVSYNSTYIAKGNINSDDLKIKISNVRDNDWPDTNNAHKQNIATIKNQSISSTTAYTSSPSTAPVILNDSHELEKFKKILSNYPINLDELRNACWTGIPKMYRPICWKLLSDYLPLKLELQEKTLEQKRNSYWELVNEYYTQTYLDAHHETLRQILNDIPRMNPSMQIFQKKQVQDIFQRILYVWSVRHPASGYVQGINDLVTPFFAVFLTEYIKDSKKSECEIEWQEIAAIDEKNMRQLEADCFGCMTKLLDRIQENYVFSQPGIQKKVQSLDDLIKRIDERLHRHLRKNNIEFLQFSFRWMNNLLMREMPLNCTIRLWDTYNAEQFGFSDFHLYVCAAFLLRFSKDLMKQKDFQDLMLLLQNLPTRSWTYNDINLLTAEAYKLHVMFANSPKHVNSSNSSTQR